MYFIPAIDLKDGNCVRLVRGDMNAATVFAHDPAAQARSFEDAGCAWLHVVDLDGAFAGKPVNGLAVEGILSAVSMRVQLGGGIRDARTAANWLEKGVSRVILGTAAMRDPELVKGLCRDFPGCIAIGIDARRGRVAVEGWAEVSAIPVRDLALKFEDAGAAAIIHTDVDRDGAMEGPNLAATVALARAISTPVIASGGIASMDDLVALKRVGQGLLEGVISGRAVYEGKIDPARAAELLRDGNGEMETD